jgi:hypothetical protein
MPSGTYTVESTIMNIADSNPLKGGFRAAYTIPEQNSSVYSYTIVGGGFLDSSGKAAKATALNRDCGLSSITSSEQRSTIVMKPAFSSQCSCASLKALAETEFPNCVNTSAIFQNVCTGYGASQSCTIECSLNSVKSAVSACGYELKGCSSV